MNRMIATALAALLACPAAAQQRPCVPRTALVQNLAEKYGETRRAVGLVSPSAMMELFASDDTGTWTIAVTNGAGISCLVGSGRFFEATDEPLPPKGEVN